MEPRMMRERETERKGAGVRQEGRRDKTSHGKNERVSDGER
jgi:hypothetical protein